MVTGNENVISNLSLQAKFELARRQSREAAHMEYSKAGYRDAKPFEAEGFEHRPARVPTERASFWNHDKPKAAYVTARPAPRISPLHAAWAEAGQFTLIRR